jgi:hypothetical protein
MMPVAAENTDDLLVTDRFLEPNKSNLPPSDRQEGEIREPANKPVFFRISE